MSAASPVVAPSGEWLRRKGISRHGVVCR